jgi:sarcosine oxidase
MHYDVIVCGLGAMGSAAVYQLAGSGVKVLGLDRFQPPHDLGSSHGKTRIIREAYFEHPIYVPLVQRAYELWRDLGAKSGRQLLLQTGGLMVGDPDGVLVTGARRSAEEHKLAHQVLSGSELRARFPAFAAKDEEVAVWEPRAGILFPELAIQTHLELAANHGADLKTGHCITKWEPFGSGVRVFTDSADFTTDRLLITAGAWLSKLVPELRLPLTIERQVLFWFEPATSEELFAPNRFPVFIWENEPHRFFYGFPDIGDGVKIAVHHDGEMSDPDRLNREISREEAKRAQDMLRRYLPAAAGNLRSAAVCMYTNTPDEHFILDFHPSHRQVLIASPCSGHGFKFSPVIAEIASLMLQAKRPAYNLDLFRIGRFNL